MNNDATIHILTTAQFNLGVVIDQLKSLDDAGLEAAINTLEDITVVLAAKKEELS